jgi:hypothetical protein
MANSRARPACSVRGDSPRPSGNAPGSPGSARTPSGASGPSSTSPRASSGRRNTSAPSRATSASMSITRRPSIWTHSSAASTRSPGSGSPSPIRGYPPSRSCRGRPGSTAGYRSSTPEGRRSGRSSMSSAITRRVRWPMMPASGSPSGTWRGATSRPPRCITTSSSSSTAGSVAHCGRVPGSVRSWHGSAPTSSPDGTRLPRRWAGWQPGPCD